MGHKEGRPEREVQSDTGLSKKDRKFQISKLTLHVQELEEQQQNKTHSEKK